MARPREIDRDKLLADFEQYIDSTEIPIVAEFAYKAGLYRQQLYEIEELSDALKRCTSKKEAMLEKEALSGNVNCTMAIFSLKQLGWKDAAVTQTQQLDKEGNPITPGPTYIIAREEIKAIDQKLDTEV